MVQCSEEVVTRGACGNLGVQYGSGLCATSHHPQTWFTPARLAEAIGTDNAGLGLAFGPVRLHWKWRPSWPGATRGPGRGPFDGGRRGKGRTEQGRDVEFRQQAW